MKKTITLAVAISVGTVFPLMTTTVSVAQPKPDRFSVTLDGQDHSAQGVTERVMQDGTIAATISRGQSVARVSGPRGSVATVTTETGATREGASAAAGGVGVSVTMPDLKHADLSAVERDYRARGRSVVLDAVATGMSFDDALKAFGDMDPEGTAALIKRLAASTTNI